MERSRNFYKTIRLGYILISVLIGCIAYNSFYEWQEIEALELDNKKIDEFRKEINNINIQMIKFSLFAINKYTIFRQAKAFCDEKMKREAGVFATGLQGKCTIFDTKEE